MQYLWHNTKHSGILWPVVILLVVLSLYPIWRPRPLIENPAMAAGMAATPKENAKLTAEAARAAVPKPDDFVIIFSGNWEGRLEPCGCAEHMLGGIDRRSHLLNAVPQKQRLLVDIGSLVNEELWLTQNKYKFGTFLRSLKQLGYDAIGLTTPERKLVAELAPEPAGVPPIVATYPAAPEGSLPVAVLPYFEKTLQAGKESLRCLVIAVADTEDHDKAVAAVETTLKSKRLAPDSSSDSYFVIALVATEQPELVKKLKAIKALDLLVTADAYDTPEILSAPGNSPVVVSVGIQGRYIARFDIPAEKVNELTKDYFQAIPIEPNFEKDPKILDLMQNYLDQLRIEKVIENETPRQPLPDPDNFFVGSEFCASCHKEEYDKWKSVRHSHAMITLQERKDPSGRDFDPRCVQCHSVGMKYVGGYKSMEETPELAHVGCEMCHGPGFKHMQSTEPKDLTNGFTKCTDCHDPENDPHFEEDYEKKFQTIKHWIGKRSDIWYPNP